MYGRYKLDAPGITVSGGNRERIARAARPPRTFGIERADSPLLSAESKPRGNILTVVLVLRMHHLSYLTTTSAASSNDRVVGPTIQRYGMNLPQLGLKARSWIWLHLETR